MKALLYHLKKEQDLYLLLITIDCVATLFTALLISWESRLQFCYCLIKKKLHTQGFLNFFINC